MAAGNGKLSYWLQKKGIDVIATDKNWSRLDSGRMDSETALKQYKTKSVISAWLENPYEGAPIIEHPNVRFHIDIGPGRERSDAPAAYSDRYAPVSLKKSSQFAIGWTDSYTRQRRVKILVKSHCSSGG